MANILDLLQKNPGDNTFTHKSDKGIMALFVGESGSGKDNAQASFTDLGPMYVFDLDNRIRGMASALQWVDPEKYKTIDFDFYNPRDGFNALNNKLDKFLSDANSRNLKYKTICINSISSLVACMILTSRYMRQGGGRVVDGLKVIDPSDYNFASMALRQIIWMYAMPMVELGVNVIFSGHVVDRWGKPGENPEAGRYLATDDPNRYSANIVIGKKLLCPDKLSEEIPGYFDEVYLFSRSENASMVKYTVEFSGSFAKTALPIVGQKLDLTKKSFYSQWSQLVSSKKFTLGV
jgi:hypothetical protein